MPATRPQKPITRQEIKRMLRQKAGSSGAGGVSTTGIKDGAVTFEKIQDVNPNILIGRDGPGVGPVTEITVTDGIEFSGSDKIRLSDTGVTPGTYGSAADIPVITVDAKGRVTAITEATATGGGISGLLVTGDTPGPVFVANGAGEPVYI